LIPLGIDCAGKLFRTVQLPALIHFLLMFYTDKPSDWLLDNMVQTKVCRFDQTTVSAFLFGRPNAQVTHVSPYLSPVECWKRAS
jgi:hypothetical protein